MEENKEENRDNYDLDNEKFERYYDTTTDPNKTIFKKIYNKDKFTRGNRHYIKKDFNKKHIFNYEEYCKEYFDTIIMTVKKNDFSTFDNLVIKTDKIEILKLNNNYEIFLYFDCILKNEDYLCFRLPKIILSWIKSSLIIETNIETEIMIMTYRMSDYETERYKSCGEETFFDDVLFLYYDTNENIIDLNNDLYCAATEIKVLCTNENIKELSLTPDLNFIKSDDLLYNYFNKKIFNNQILQKKYFHLKAYDKFMLIGTGLKFLFNGMIKKSIKITKEEKEKNCSVIIMIKYVGILQDGIKASYPYIWKLNINYSSPLTKVSEHEYIEGYWQTKYFYMATINYPFPVESNEPNDNVFKEKLQKLILKLHTEGNFVEYLGSSVSRLTDEFVGNKEYFVFYKDIKFRFPEGVVHYYCDHNVKPSNEFYDLVMNY